MDRLVSDADLDWRTTERARFAANMLTSALAPTNFLPGNPASLKSNGGLRPRAQDGSGEHET
jgi:polyhydroxyalkanoate synthase subunit PhaC